jgi:hypothetical protein
MALVMVVTGAGFLRRAQPAKIAANQASAAAGFAAVRIQLTNSIYRVQNHQALEYGIASFL